MREGGRKRPRTHSPRIPHAFETMRGVCVGGRLGTYPPSSHPNFHTEIFQFWRVDCPRMIDDLNDTPWLAQHEPFSDERIGRIADFPDEVRMPLTEGCLLYEMRALARSVRALREAARALDAELLAEMLNTTKQQALRALLPKDTA